MGSCFITLEGVEGAGKSTLRDALALKFGALNQELILTREPGATAIGRRLREILLDPQNTQLAPLAELMLFCADRAQHVAEVIQPGLKRGSIVICDRYIHSTLAYQGYARGLALDKLNSLMDFVTNGLLPDVVLLLDLDPALGLARVQTRESGPTKHDRIEELALDFHRRVRQGFLAMAQADEKRFILLDATLDAETLAERAFSEVTKRIKVS